MKTQIEEAETPNADDKLKISPDLTFEPRQNNNHYVVPVGLLIVLVTIYLMVEGLQLNYKRFSESSVAATKLNTIQNEAMAPQMLPTCIELDIFTEQQDDKSLSFSNARNQLMKPNPQSKATKRKAQNGNAGSKLSKVPRMNKQLEMSNKKDSPKKSNTAEPIIYLFALVFIYLLLKAASDINQHYKSQNKGDKRLRRCSLQSYAQAHKDRRASKDSPLRRRHNILSPARSISVDRYKYVISEERDIAATRHMPTIMRKQTSLGDSADTATSAYISRAPIRENSGQAFEGGDKPLEFKRSMSFTRRCSVPVSINYQTVQVVHHSGAHLQRRSSNINMGSLTGMNLDMQTNSILETKRRVRMINRH